MFDPEARVSHICTHILFQFELDIRIALSNEIGVGEVRNSVEVHTEDSHVWDDMFDFSKFMRRSVGQDECQA